MRTYVLDCGRNTSTLYDSLKDETITITHAEVLNLPERLEANSLLVSEKAHIGVPRTKRSKAQPFTADQLLDLYSRFESNGITLRLFPEMSTPRACSYSGLEKSDLNDPKSLFIWLRDYPNTSLMKPRESFEPTPLREEMWQFKDETNVILNAARVGEKKEIYYHDGCGQFIVNNLEFIANNLSETAKECFNLTDEHKYKHERYKDEITYPFKPNSIKKMQIYTVLCTLIDDDGNERLRQSTNELAGWQFVKQGVFGFTPFHRRGGTARSNLIFHGLMSYVNQTGKEAGFNFMRKVEKPDPKAKGGKKTVSVQLRRGDMTPEEDAFFLERRKEYCDAVRELWQLGKSILTGSRDSVYQSKQLEFKI